jgi:hypothetical protein
VESNDMRWIGLLEAEASGSLEGEDAGALARFREISPLLPSYSMCEPFFALVDGALVASPQLRIDSAGAVSTARHNGTFRDGSELKKMPPGALVVSRAVIRNKRSEVAKEIKKVAEAACGARMDRKQAKMEAGRVKQRAEHAQMLVAQDLYVPTSAELVKAIGQMRDRGDKQGTKAAAQALAEEVSTSPL